MTLTTRLLPNSLTPGAIDGDDYIDKVHENVLGLWDRSVCTLENLGGTANAITADVKGPPLAAGLAFGMSFVLVPAAPNTGSVTIAIGGGGPIAIVNDDGDPLVANQLKAGRKTLLWFDGTALHAFGTILLQKVCDFQLVTAAGAGLWTKPAGCPADARVTARLWAGGGGGAANTRAAGGGGGAYVEATFRAGDLASTVALYVSPAVSAGWAGENSTFGALLIAYGGGKGGGTNASPGGTSYDSGGAGAGNLRAGADGASGVSSRPAAGGRDAGGGGYYDGSALQPPEDGGDGGAGGGAARGTGTDGCHGGSAFRGGAGGGGMRYAAGTGGLGGTSKLGGNGGNAGSPGSPRGGGGGANAPGGRGEIQIFTTG